MTDAELLLHLKGKTRDDARCMLGVVCAYAKVSEGRVRLAVDMNSLASLEPGEIAQLKDAHPKWR